MSPRTASETPDPEAPDLTIEKEVGQKPIVQVIRRAGPEREDVIKLGLCGPPRSGKTTYLAALPLAVSHVGAQNGSWAIFPHGNASADLLERFEKKLAEERRFPAATVSASVPLEWEFVGDLARSKFDRRMLRRRELESRFVLDLIDVHGGAYQRDHDLAKLRSEIGSPALDHLGEAQGIIYMFDPIGEQANRDSADYLRRVLNELKLRAAENGRPGRYLDQQVSVCITKFDNPGMFQQARRMNLVSYGADGMPRVRDEDAEQFFDELCNGRFWNRRYGGGQQSAELVRRQLRNAFHPDRIRYFVTSSIGFWLEPPTEDRPSASFNLEDYQNYNEADIEPGIRGMVRPINVLEPLISVQQRIARG